MLFETSRPQRLFSEPTHLPKRDLYMVVPASLLVIVTSYYPHDAKLQTSHSATLIIFMVSLTKAQCMPEKGYNLGKVPGV